MDVAIRDQTVPLQPGESLFKYMKDIGVGAVELWVDPKGAASWIKVEDAAAYSIKDAANIEALQKRLDDESVRASALLIATDFSSDQAAEQVEWAVHTVRAAKELNVPVVRIDTYTANKSITNEQHRENFSRRIAEVLKQTANTGVDLGIENHGPVSNDPKWLDGVFASVPDPRLGMTLDTGNFYWWGFPLNELYVQLEHFAPRAKHTHIKNINYPTDVAQIRREVGYEYGKYCSPLDEGNIDVKRVVSILEKFGYNRDLCIENESLFRYPPEEQKKVLHRDAKTLRNAIV